MNKLIVLNSVLESDLFISILTVIVSSVIAYLTARYQYKKQYNNGKILLYEIVKRYFILLMNNRENQDGITVVKTDTFSKEFYDSELTIIYNDFKSLFTNPIMIRYIDSYNGLSKLVISINREIIKRKELSKENKQAIENPDTIIGFIDLYLLLKKEIGTKKIISNDDLKEIDDFVNYLNQNIKVYRKLFI